MSKRGSGTSASEDRGRARPQEHKARKSQKNLLQNHKINNQLAAPSYYEVVIRVRVRVRVTELVYQIGFTTPF